MSEGETTWMVVQPNTQALRARLLHAITCGTPLLFEAELCSSSDNNADAGTLTRAFSATVYSGYFGEPEQYTVIDTETRKMFNISIGANSPITFVIPD